MTVVVEIPRSINVDIFRLVELSPGGRPVEILDLEDGGTYSKVKKTLKVGGFEKQQQFSRRGGRYGGAMVVREFQGNGTLSVTLGMIGVSVDQCLSQVEALLAEVDDERRGRFLESREQDASHSYLYEIAGPGTWNHVTNREMLRQNSVMLIEVTWPIFPLARGLPCDVHDDFAVDSEEDYSFDAGTSADVAVSAEALTPTGTLTTERRLIHTARGYPFLDVQGTRKFIPGATTTSFKGGVVLCRSAVGTYIEVYVDDDGTNSRLRIDMVISGARTNRASVNLASRIGSGSSFWVRGRREGNVIYAEHFTAEPTPTGAPTTQSPTGGAGYTLSAGEITNLVEGQLGFSWIPRHANARLDDYRDEPWTYRNRTLPQTIDLGGEIPGTAPASCDLEITPSAEDVNRIFGLFAWAKSLPAALPDSLVPFGVLDAGVANYYGAWTLQNDETAYGGSSIKDETPTAGETYTVEWRIDPSVLSAEALLEDSVVAEVWCRVLLGPDLVAPRLAVELSSGFVGFPSTYTEHGPTGKLLTLPVGTWPWRFTRLGTISLDTLPAADWRVLEVNGFLGTGSGGSVWGIDYIVIVLAKARASSPTGKSEINYPNFASTFETLRIIKSDLSGYVADVARVGKKRVAGLGGALIEFNPGGLSLFAKLSNLVPDNPTPDTASEQLSHIATVHAAVTPRYHLARSE